MSQNKLYVIYDNEFDGNEEIKEKLINLVQEKGNYTCLFCIHEYVQDSIELSKQFPFDFVVFNNDDSLLTQDWVKQTISQETDFEIKDIEWVIEEV